VLTSLSVKETGRVSLSRGWGVGREKAYGQGTGYSAESALLLVARAIPSAPPLFTTVVCCCDQEDAVHALSSFFLH